MRWKQVSLHFAHSEIGMWTIEPRRGSFLIDLTRRKGTRGAVKKIGSARTLSAARKLAEKAAKTIAREL